MIKTILTALSALCIIIGGFLMYGAINPFVPITSIFIIGWALSFFLAALIMMFMREILILLEEIRDRIAPQVVDRPGGTQEPRWVTWIMGADAPGGESWLLTSIRRVFERSEPPLSTSDERQKAQAPPSSDERDDRQKAQMPPPLTSDERQKAQDAQAVAEAGRRVRE